MDITRMDEIAVLRMRAGKANAIGPAFLEAMRARVRELAASDASAVVLTGDGRFFSAGLALPELVALDRAAMRDMIRAFEEVMEAVHALALPVVAAIDGHAIAGGCVLALQCDRRLMAAGGAKIGLNEVALGIGLPPSAVEALRAAVPASSVLDIALRGELFVPDAARALGLVDEVVPAGELEGRAVDLARELGANGAAYAQIKSALRQPALERMRASREEAIERWLDTWFSPLGRARLEAAVARLRG